MADEATERVERELTALVQRALRGPLLDDGTGRTLDRAAYAVLARLHDDGAMRLTALATLLGLDTSTVSRQVQTLTEAGLVERRPDPRDRRAAQVELSAEGRRRLLGAREHRRAFLARLLGAWPEDDRRVLADLLERLNADVAAARASSAPVPAGGPRR